MKADLISTAVFKNIPIFRGYSAAEWERLLDIAEVGEFQPGEVILMQGERSQRLWVLLEGCCEVYHTLAGQNASEPTTLATLEPFANFGEMSFFHPAPHSVSARVSPRSLRSSICTASSRPAAPSS